MTKKTNKIVDDKHSFWTTLPGILTAAATVLTSIWGFVVALHTIGVIGDGTKQPPSDVSSRAPTRFIQTSAVNSQMIVGTTAAGCFVEYFQGIAGDRVIILEEGTQDFQLIGPDQTKEEPIGIQFTDYGQTVGAIIFRFYSNGQIFKVDSVVDAGCADIQDFSNATRGGDKNNLQNADTLQMRLGEADYQLRLEYNGAIMVNKFRRFTP